MIIVGFKKNVQISNLPLIKSTQLHARRLCLFSLQLWLLARTWRPRHATISSYIAKCVMHQEMKNIYLRASQKLHFSLGGHSLSNDGYIALSARKFRSECLCCFDKEYHLGIKWRSSCNTMSQLIVQGVLCQNFRKIDQWGSWQIGFFTRGALIMKRWVLFISSSHVI